MNRTIALAHESKLSEELNEIMYLIKFAEKERLRGQEYIKFTQGCVERISGDMLAAESVEEMAVLEEDPVTKETFLSQATFRHSEASANLKNVFDTVDHIIELSEINAALKIKKLTGQETPRLQISSISKTGR